MQARAHRGRRIGAYVASAALALSGTLAVASPAQAAPHDPIGQDQGATWLAGELTDGLMHNPNYGGFDDYGLSVDTAFALDAVGGHDDTVGEVADALADNIDAYTTYGDHVYAGSLAKLAVLADTDGDATSFGGRDLITAIEGRVSGTAPIAGRVEDEGFTPGDQFDDDTANTLGQAYAVHALSTHGSSQAAAARDFLLEQQCSSGYFRLNFTADKTAAGQSCVDGTDPEDTDATAVAVLELQDVAGTATAVADAKDWLIAAQRPDGSWGGGPSTEGANANSTGLAAWALGDGPEAEEAAQWLRDHQATDLDQCNRLRTSRGAIAYDDAGLAAGRREGITDASSDQWRRASAQALPALQYLPTEPSGSLRLTVPGRFRKAGGSMNMSTTGAPVGTELCLTGPGVRVRGTTTADPWSVTKRVPAGTADRHYVVRDAHGHADSTMVHVLGSRTLEVRKSSYRVKRSGVVTAVIRGLAPGERARVYYRSRLVGIGTATRIGRFAATFHVGRPLGTQLIRGYGQFADIRRGTTTIKVVR